MKRRTTIIWGTIVGVIALAVTVFWLRSDLVRRPGADLESLLAAGSENPGAAAEPSAERDWVVKAVKDSTGRTFAIEGAFDAYLLPLPGLLIGRASLSNAEGFGDAPFAVIDGMEVRVGSVSPFTREVTVERAALAGLRLQLERNAAGENNWDDMTRPRQGASAAAPAEPVAPTAASEDDSGWSTSVEAIEITDAIISWQDRMTGGYWKLGAFNLIASGIQPEAAFPLAISFAYERDAIAVVVESAMRASAAKDLLRLDDLAFAFRDVDAGELKALFGSTVVTGDEELLARAGASGSLEFSGAGTYDGVTRQLDFSGDVRLADGALVPVTIRGTLEAPGVSLGP